MAKPYEGRIELTDANPPAGAQAGEAVPRAQAAAACSDAYAIFALLFQLPSADEARGLADGSLVSDLRDIAAELDSLAGSALAAAIEEPAAALEAACAGKDPEAFMHELRIEYTRLFDHPDWPLIRIYEALFLYAESHDRADPKYALPRMFVNKAALDAERCYRGMGLVRDPNVRIPADHMATELEFLSYVHRRRAEALLAGDAEAFVHADAALAEFDHLHVEKWFAPFFARVAETAQGPYVHLAQLSTVFTSALRP